MQLQKTAILGTAHDRTYGSSDLKYRTLGVGSNIACTMNSKYRILSRDMVCFRNISVNTQIMMMMMITIGQG
jgi:hypothetical protein